MNDVKSLLIATTVLAIGGLGLYIFKSEDSELGFDDHIDDNNSETASESGSETGSELDDEIEELDYDDYKNNVINKYNQVVDFDREFIEVKKFIENKYLTFFQ
jgi:hypothetical protein